MNNKNEGFNLSEITGEKFLAHIADYESKCAARSNKDWKNLGVKGEECYETLGMALALLDCASCCYWGCNGGNHKLEFLFGRATNTAYAALSLLKNGYYDQALSLARTLGEIANLLTLFAFDNNKISEWENSDEALRKTNFSPVKIRLTLESLGFPLPIDKERYSKLSTFTIHAIPDGLPQAHNATGQAITFPVFQGAGYLMGLNEIALPIGFILLYAANLLGLKDKADTFRDIGRALIQSLGGAMVTVNGRPWFKLD